jgi:hypothetical protein
MFQPVFDAIQPLFHSLNAGIKAADGIFQPFDLGFQKIPQVVEASVHGIAQIVDPPVLEIDPEQVTGYDYSDRPPLINHRLHESLVLF